MTTLGFTGASLDDEEGSDTARSATRRLARVAWLQHRGSLFGLGVFFLGFALTILFEEHLTGGSYSRFVADGCAAPQFSSACNTDALGLGDFVDFKAIGTALALLPLVVGVFVGAPLVARELESGTFCFAWTQGTHRTRVLSTTFVTLAGAAGGTALVLGLLFGGSYAHVYEVVLNESQWQDTLFATTWWMLTVWTLLGLSFGTLAGTLIKRAIPAMAATGAIIGGLLVAANVYLSDYLHLGAVTASRATESFYGVGPINAPAQLGSEAPAGSWVVRSWLTGARGQVLDQQQVERAAAQMSGCGTARTPLQCLAEHPSAAKGGTSAEAEWLARHHDAYRIAYQPASHFWMLQGLQGLIVLALAALCVLATLRRIRPRALA